MSADDGHMFDAPSLSLSPSLLLSRAASTSAQPYGKIGPRFVASKFQLLCLHDDGVLLRSPPWGSELSNGSFASLQTATCLLCSSWEPVRDCRAVPCVSCVRSFRLLVCSVWMQPSAIWSGLFRRLIGTRGWFLWWTGSIFEGKSLIGANCMLGFIIIIFWELLHHWGMKSYEAGMNGLWEISQSGDKCAAKSGHVLHVDWWKTVSVIIQNDCNVCLSLKHRGQTVSFVNQRGEIV